MLGPMFAVIVEARWSAYRQSVRIFFESGGGESAEILLSPDGAERLVSGLTWLGGIKTLTLESPAAIRAASPPPQRSCSKRRSTA